MKALTALAGIALLSLAHIAAAQAACKQKRSRDPSFIELAVPEDAVRPAGPQDFAFVTDDVSIDQLFARVGPPDASQGSRVITYVWCFADESELTVTTPDRVLIDQIRHGGKLLYKRNKKK
jgi:hypothetical protein